MSPSQGPWKDRYRYGGPEAYGDWDRAGTSSGEHAVEESMPMQNSGSKNGRSYERVYDEESRNDSRSGFGSRERKYDSLREYEYEKRTQQMRRRGSPVYEEYSGRDSDPHDRSMASSSQPMDYESRGLGHADMSSRSYSTYRRQPEHERRSASPEGSSSKVYFLPPKFAPRTPPPRPSPIDLPPPSPPRRTEPTAEYVATSLHSSMRLDDPTLLRKLIVLDLNGTLVLRSAHQKRMPYANPTQPRPLRTVHPRPYLSSFVSYVMHPETKKWLDTMVWSSAQPHSVDDMVQRSFKERRKELKAIWARDTLGLSGDSYYQKTQTVKDLEKPWAEISALPPPPPLPPRAVDLSSVVPFDDVEIQPPQPASSEHKPRHSAKTTLLVDDSPLKAILQPWNHLCIREYVQEMRRLDLAVADWEWAERTREANEKRKALENQVDVEDFVQETNQGEDTNTTVAATLDTTAFNPDVKRVIHEVVMIDGQMVNTEEVVKRVTREVVMIQGKLVDDTSVDNPSGGQSKKHARRKLKRMEKREKERKEREEKEREAFMSLAGQRQASGSNSASASTPSPASLSGNEQLQEELDGHLPKSTSVVGNRRVLEEPTTIEAQGVQDPPIQYDPTLLAVIGILDHLKHEENVAGWMRSGGLLHIPTAASASASASDSGILEEEEDRATMATDTEKPIHTPPTRGASPSDLQGPAKRRRVEEDAETDLEIQPPPSARRMSLPPSSSPPGSPGILPPSSPGATIVPPSSQITTFELVSPSDSARATEKEKQGATGIPTSPAPAATSPSSPTAAEAANTQKLWFEHPTVLAYWASRGREALQELGIEVESGIERAPGGLQQKQT